MNKKTPIPKEERQNFLPFIDFCRENKMTMKTFADLVGIDYIRMYSINRGTLGCTMIEARRIYEKTFGMIKKEWCIFPKMYQEHKKRMKALGKEVF